MDPIKSRYGVYRDLEKSPYEFTNPYGDTFKFRSQKKLEIYQREIEKEVERVGKFLGRLGLESYIPSEIVGMLYRRTYRALYDHVEG
jgi:hypothetical protein